MHKEPSIAFLVADRGRARLLVRHSDGRYETLASLAASAAHSRPADTRGRVFAGMGQERSALGEPPERVDQALLHEAAAAVDAGLAAGAFEHLVLVGPARALPLYLKHLSARAAEAVVGRLSKDLTKLPEAELHHVLDAHAVTPAQPAG